MAKMSEYTSVDKQSESVKARYMKDAMILSSGPSGSSEGKTNLNIPVSEFTKTQSDWNEGDTTSPAYIKNKPEIPEVKQADWNQEAAGQPDFIKNKPELHKVATTGNYNDLKNKPVIPEFVQANWAQNTPEAADYIQNKPDMRDYAKLNDLADVATSGNYEDLAGTPTKLSEFTNDTGFTANKGTVTKVKANGAVFEPSASGVVDIGETFKQADWNQNVSTQPDYIQNKPVLAEVATSGDYEDLDNKPTDVSEFNNDAGYQTAADIAAAVADKANKSEMSITDVQGELYKKTITLKNGLSANVITEHQDIDSKANKSELQISSVSGDNTKKKIQLLSDLSTNVVVEHQDISGKADLSAVYTKSQLDSKLEQKADVDHNHDDLYYRKSTIDSALGNKQDLINDLDEIRSGAEAGAAAVQPGDLAAVATSGKFVDLDTCSAWSFITEIDSSLGDVFGIGSISMRGDDEKFVNIHARHDDDNDGPIMVFNETSRNLEWGDFPVKDVQMNGESILNGNIASFRATEFYDFNNNTLSYVQLDGTGGLDLDGNNIIVSLSGNGIWRSEGKLETHLGEGLHFNQRDGLDKGAIEVDSDIIDGAQAGTTAVQPDDLADVATSGDYNDLENTPERVTGFFDGHNWLDTFSIGSDGLGGLILSNDEIPTLSVNAGPGIDADEEVTVKLGNGLDFDNNNAIALDVNQDFTFDQGCLNFCDDITGKGLFYNGSGDREGAINLILGDGLDYGAEKLIGYPIEVKLGDGLEFGDHTEYQQAPIAVKTGDGLEIDDEGAVAVKAGDGLNIDDDGAVSVENSLFSDIANGKEIYDAFCDSIGSNGVEVFRNEITGTFNLKVECGDGLFVGTMLEVNNGEGLGKDSENGLYVTNPVPKPNAAGKVLKSTGTTDKAYEWTTLESETFVFDGYCRDRNGTVETSVNIDDLLAAIEAKKTVMMRCSIDVASFRPNDYTILKLDYVSPYWDRWIFTSSYSVADYDPFGSAAVTLDRSGSAPNYTYTWKLSCESTKELPEAASGSGYHTNAVLISPANPSGQSGDLRDPEWMEVGELFESMVPYDSSDAGKVLAINSRGKPEWADPQSGSDIPDYSSEEANKVLTVSSDGSSLEWATPSGGGGTPTAESVSMIYRWDPTVGEHGADVLDSVSMTPEQALQKYASGVALTVNVIRTYNGEATEIYSYPASYMYKSDGYYPIIFFNYGEGSGGGEGVTASINPDDATQSTWSRT